MWQPPNGSLQTTTIPSKRKRMPTSARYDGHIELSSRGDPPWQPPYGTAGAVQNKVADATMAERMSFSAAAGHACGLDFKADEHLQKHTGFAWEKPLLRDMDAYPWTVFSITP